MANQWDDDCCASRTHTRHETADIHHIDSTIGERLGEGVSLAQRWVREELRTCNVAPTKYTPPAMIKLILLPNILREGNVAKHPTSPPICSKETMLAVVLLYEDVPSGASLKSRMKEGRTRTPPMTPLL